MRDGIGGAEARLQPPGDRDEQAIRGHGPQTVVHRLEAVETEDEQREGAVLAALGPLDRAVEQIDEQQPVGQPRQRIGHLSAKGLRQSTTKSGASGGSEPTTEPRSRKSIHDFKVQ